MSVYVIWKFAENIDGAKKFLVDYIDHFSEAFEERVLQLPDLPEAGPGPQAADREGLPRAAA